MFGLAPEEWRDVVLSVNVHRKERRLSPYPLALLLQRALTRGSVDDIASALNFSDTTTLRKIMRIAELPPSMADTVQWGNRKGTISMSTASEILRLRSSADAASVVKAAVEYALTKEEARQVVQIRERSGRTVNECVEEALNTRPRIERSELILGTLLSDGAKQTAETLGEIEASALLRRRLASQFPEVVVAAARITGSRFSLLLKEEQASALRANTGSRSIEELVSSLIEGT